MRTISCGPDRRPYVVPPPCPLVLKSKETFSDDFAPFFRPVGWCWRGKCPLTARNLREFVVTFEICEARGYNVSALPDFVPVDLSMTCAVSLLSHPSQRFREWVVSTGAKLHRITGENCTLGPPACRRMR